MVRYYVYFGSQRVLVAVGLSSATPYLDPVVIYYYGWIARAYPTWGRRIACANVIIERESPAGLVDVLYSNPYAASCASDPTGPCCP